MLPDFKFERTIWRKRFNIVAGLDEVGRGCFAGPVVAGCVSFPNNITIKQFNNLKIDDSKKLRARQRERSASWIKENALTWGIGEAPASLINRIGMGRATKVAFRRAITNANLKIDYLLIDAFFIPYVRGLARKHQLAIVNGDEKSISIAAASIIAKVYRDSLMRRLSKELKFKKYAWGRNKGYGTREHQGAIKKYGLTRYHRKKFVETWLKKREF